MHNVCRCLIISYSLVSFVVTSSLSLVFSQSRIIFLCLSLPLSLSFSFSFVLCMAVAFCSLTHSVTSLLQFNSCRAKSISYKRMAKSFASFCLIEWQTGTSLQGFMRSHKFFVFFVALYDNMCRFILLGHLYRHTVIIALTVFRFCLKSFHVKIFLLHLMFNGPMTVVLDSGRWTYFEYLSTFHFVIEDDHNSVESTIITLIPCLRYAERVCVCVRERETCMKSKGGGGFVKSSQNPKLCN